MRLTAIVLILAICAVPVSAALIITEVMQNPDAVYDADGEWFEVYNTGPDAVDMFNYRIFDIDFDDFSVTEHIVVPVGGFVIFGRNANPGENGGVTVDYEWSNFILANGDDEIVIYDELNQLIDQIMYDGGPNWPDPNGASMFYDWGGDNNAGAYWHVEAQHTFGLGDFGTPGYDPRMPSGVDGETWSSIKALYRNAS